LTLTGSTALTSVNASAYGGAVTTTLVASGTTYNGAVGVDNVTGSAGADNISGNNGNDVLSGAAGADTINGGAGDDQITGGAGADVIDGGTGTNTLIASGGDANTGPGTISGVVVNLSAANISYANIFATTGAYLSGTLTGGVDAGRVGYLFDGESALNIATLDTVSNIQIVTGGTGADYIVGSAVANTITGGAGADTIDGGAGADRVVQGLTDSVARTASTFAGAAVAAADTITFGNRVDVISGFVAGAAGDVLDVLVAGAPTSLIGETVADLTAGQEVFFVSGAYNATTRVFTIAADGTGADTAIVQADNAVAASDALTTNASIVILVGVDSDNLVAANFI